MNPKPKPSKNISKVAKQVQSLNKPKPMVTSNRKKTAQSIRDPKKPMPGSNSTHLMQHGESGNKKYKYDVNPTIFPNKDGSWTDYSNDPKAAYSEAKKRGETFGFKREKKAEKFAAGSWKKGQDRKEAMKNYRQDKRQNKKK
jgi:hypothetical protein